MLDSAVRYAIVCACSVYSANKSISQTPECKCIKTRKYISSCPLCERRVWWLFITVSISIAQLSSLYLKNLSPFFVSYVLYKTIHRWMNYMLFSATAAAFDFWRNTVMVLMTLTIDVYERYACICWICWRYCTTHLLNCSLTWLTLTSVSIVLCHFECLKSIGISKESQE